MARDGENPLARFAQALARGDGWTIGAPVVSDGGAAAILPILRTSPRPRRCVLAAEASDRISAVDSGRLDRIVVRNDASFAVFLPPGAVFRSDDTAARGTTAGVILGPGSEAAVDVKCVHASSPVAPGAGLQLDSHLAPDGVRQALLSRDQGRVWAAVAALLGPSPHGSDDLVAALAASDPVGEPVHGNPAVGSTPPGQCGRVILDALGVAAIEWIDNPESWKALAASLPSHRLGRLHPPARSPWIASLDAAGAVRAAMEFLVQAAGQALYRVAPSSWVADGLSLECTAVDGELIHLVAFRREEVPSSYRIGPEAAASEAASEAGLEPSSDLSTVAGPDDAEVSTVGMASEGVPEDTLSAPVPVRSRRRKVLTSGWDAATFDTLDRYARKEFRGDRSAAMRFLVRQGLRGRGYFGPLPVRPPAHVAASPPEEEVVPPAAERARAGLEARLQDFERIAETPEYAVWLRKRARLELERMTSTLEDDLLRSAARAALDRLSPMEPEAEPEPQESVEEEVPPAPPPPPLEIRSLLRQAFAASAGGDYRQAIALFDGILDAEAGNRTARLGRAVAFRRAGKSQEALDDLEIVLAAEPRNAAALLARGQILQARGDLDGALASFDLLVAVASSDWDVWVARGDVLAKMGRNEDALRSYEEALRRNPDDPSLRARIRTVEVARLPAPPTTLPRPPVPPGIEEGQSYLVREPRHERSYSLFRALASQKLPSLILTGRSRDLVRREVGLTSARIIGLSFSPGEDLHNPTALASLIRTIERFVYDNQGHGVILLDGLHDLVANNGFRETVLCVERVHEVILQSRAILIVSVAPEDLAEREAALLERNLRLLP